MITISLLQPRLLLYYYYYYRNRAQGCALVLLLLAVPTSSAYLQRLASRELQIVRIPIPLKHLVATRTLPLP